MTRSLLRKLAGAILPRRRAGVLLLALLTACALLAQYRSKRRPAHVLRALGVLEWPAAGKSVPRLVPLVILADGQYYDASLYRASPVPMAVEPGTVYEGQQSGVPKGLFTISAAQEVTDKKLWFGVGTWGEGATTTATASSQGDEGRPVLRRSPREETGEPAPAAASTPAPQAPSEQQVESDPNRPVLGRGKPAPQPAAPMPPPMAQKPAPAAPAPAVPPPAAAAAKWMIAVSDAQPDLGHSFVLNWSPSEEAALTQKAVAMAEAEIAKYPIAPGGPSAVPGTFTDLQVHFFDIYTDNAPEVVLSGRLPAGEYAAAAPVRHAKARSKARAGTKQTQPDIYVTLVARGDLDGNLRKIFVSITDPSRLDSVPRLELIDAVDADGRGIGQLLFHKIGPRDTGLEGNVVLYRVDPDRLTELFDSWGQ